LLVGDRDLFTDTEQVLGNPRCATLALRAPLALHVVTFFVRDTFGEVRSLGLRLVTREGQLRVINEPLAAAAVEVALDLAPERWTPM
jgi:hypothetical protein